MSENTTPENTTPEKTSSRDPKLPASPREGLRHLVFHSLLAGLCPLIPVPFVDDWVQGIVRRRLVAGLAAERGLELDGDALRVLACGESSLVSLGGLVRGCLKKTFTLVFKLFKKVYRKVLFFLTIKDCVDVFSHTFHEAYLARHAVALGAFAGDVGWERARGVRRALEGALGEVDPRPLEQLVKRTLRGSRRLLHRAARGLGRKFRGKGDAEAVHAEVRLDDEDRLLGELVDQLTDAVGQDKGYLRHLETRLEAHLGLS